MTTGDVSAETGRKETSPDRQIAEGSELLPLAT
jgi:hypothetical protein